MRAKSLLIFFFILSFSSFSQEMRRMTFSTDDSFLLKELTAIVQLNDGKLVFELIPDQVLNQDKFKDVDLQKGDEILFVNGEKVKSIDDLNKAYNAIEVGKEIQFGIRRGKERFFATIIKEEQPAGEKQMMIMKTDNGEISSEGNKVMMNGKEVSLDSLKKAEKVHIVPQKKKKDTE